MIGSEAVQYLLASINQKDGVLHISSLTPERVAVVVNHLQYEIVFKGLSMDYIRLDRFLLRLEKDKHTGFIEILAKEGQAAAFFYFEGGDLIEMFTASESGPSLFGQKSMMNFLENAVKEGAILNVYKSQGKTLKEEKKASALEGAKSSEDRKKLILILQELLFKTEKTVDEISQKGKFIEIFKKSLIEKSNEFPFLDPFAGEFKYREGEILFESDAGDKNFAKGLMESLRTTFSSLEEEIPIHKIPYPRIRAEMESSLERHKEVVDRLGLDVMVYSMFQ
jgi:hypothetical protein